MELRILMETAELLFFFLALVTKRRRLPPVLLFPLKKMLRHAARRLVATSAAASSSLSSAAALATEAVGARGLAVAVTTPAQSSATSIFSSCRRGFASESDGERGFGRLFEHF